MMATGAASAPVALTPDQRRELDEMFVCPGKLADDAARVDAMQRFIKRFTELAPKSRPAEQLAYFDELKVRKKCPSSDHELIHTIPET